MNAQGFEQLMLFPAGSRASRSLAPGSDEARRMTVTSGRKCSASLMKSSPLGLLARMLLESSIWRSTMCCLTWKEKATKQGRLYFQLAVSAPRTGGTGSPLLPTVTATVATHGGPNQRDSSGRPGLQQAATMWPTPVVPNGGRSVASVTDWRSQRTAYKNGRKVQVDLNAAVQMYPMLLATPQARDHFPPHSEVYINKKRAEGHGMKNLNDQIGGQLNPAWVSRLMGFPDGWLDL